MNPLQFISITIYVFTNFIILYLVTNKFEKDWLSKLVHSKNKNLIPKKIRGDSQTWFLGLKLFFALEAFVLVIIFEVISDIKF